MFKIQCPILWYAKVCALPSARSSYYYYYYYVIPHSSETLFSEIDITVLIDMWWQSERHEMFQLATEGVQRISWTEVQRHSIAEEWKLAEISRRQKFLDAISFIYDVLRGLGV